MKLVNAKLYEEEIRQKMWAAWYDPKYQYYFGGDGRHDFSLADDNGGWPKRAFAVLNNSDELIGFIDYSVDTDLRIAQWFGAINFSDDKLAFGRALRQVIEDCFLKFGLEVVEWCVVCGNPIEESYDRMCAKLGRSVCGIRHRRARDLAGNICDDKIYEILREDFLKATGKLALGA